MTLLVGALFLVLGTATQVTTDERYAHDFWKRTIVIPEQQFDEASVSALAHEFCRNATGYKAAVLSIFVDRTDAGIMSGKQALPVSYETWWNEYSLYGRRQFPMAQVVVFGAGAVLRISDGRKESRRIVLRGRDPLLLSSPELSAEIIALRLYRGAPLVSGDFRKRSGAELYVMTRLPLNEPTAQSVSRVAAAMAGLEFAKVFIRNDVWFIDQVSFPVDYRFEESPPPTYEKYLSTTTFECYVEGANADCWERKPLK